MSIHNLTKIFEPASVAVVGASEKEGTIGHALVRNLKEGGFMGPIFPVNPRYEIVQGLPAYASVGAVPHPVDMAVVATPIAHVPRIVRECGAAGIAGAIVISAGGKEAGAEGKQVEVEISEAAKAAGIRIIGPNCMGIISDKSKLNASFARHMPTSGRLAFVSQSGAICSAILDLSDKEGIGFRYFVSIGSMLDVDFGDLIDYLGNDPKVSSIVLYIENLTHIRKFMSAARAVSRVKPIVVLKAGRSRAGAQAASSHTGAMTGEDAVYDAAFERAGIVRVNTIEELFDCAELMAKQPILAGKGLGIITNGGGPGVMAADALSTHGLEPVALSPETVAGLDGILPPFWSRRNPVDILGDATPERWQKAIHVCLSASEIHALLVIHVPQALTDDGTVARAVVDQLQGRPCPPVYAVWMGGDGAALGRDILNRASIPTYDTPERAVSAFNYMIAYALRREMLQEIPANFPRALEFDRAAVERIIGRGEEVKDEWLTEIDSKALIAAYGIPVTPTRLANSADEAVRHARDAGYPVAMKIQSSHITHKSDAGGVFLGLRGDSDVRDAYGKIIENARAYNREAQIDGVTVQPMVGGPSSCELILGAKRDPDFGPVILFGMGGVMTEIFKDRSLALPPLNRLLARRLMSGTRVYELLKGYRNRPAADLIQLEEILIRVSQLVTDFPEIAELDINPLVVCDPGAVALDARVRITPSTVQPPRHLVISPYPRQYESTFRTTDGLPLLVRPIRPEDAPMLESLFNCLSMQSVYYRFFTPMKSLPRQLLARFTQIDYDRDMALVAIDRQARDERILGVARLMTEPGGRQAEFAVLVGDPWQGMGIGAALMERLIAIAGERGIESLWGIALSENRQMLTLARRLGFTVTRVPGETHYELRARLTAPPKEA